MTEVFIPWLSAGIPLIGALVCLALWSDPYRVKMSAVVWSALSLMSIVGVASSIPIQPDSLLPLYLLPLTALVSSLGQPVHENHRLSWTISLVFLGLGMGVLTSGNPFGLLFLISLLLIVIFLLYRHHTALWPIS